MKMPKEYLEKYASLGSCRHCLGEIRAGDDVTISKGRLTGEADYIAVHKKCPEERFEKGPKRKERSK